MSDRDSIVPALVLFYLLERGCAGFMSWASERSDFSNEFAVYLEKKQTKFVRVKLEDEADPLDKGFMLSHLLGFAQTRLEKSEKYVFGDKLEAMPFRNTLTALKNQRNKVMHGMSPQASLEEAAASVADVFAELRSVLGDRFGQLAATRKPVDHSSWARVLQLEANDLAWIALGNALPRIEGARIEPFRLDGGNLVIDVGPTSFAPHEVRALHANKAEAVWVSERAFDVAKLEALRAHLKRQIDAEAKGMGRALEFGFNAVGPLDRDSFGVPFWAPDPGGNAFVYIWTA